MSGLDTSQNLTDEAILADEGIPEGQHRDPELASVIIKDADELGQATPGPR